MSKNKFTTYLYYAIGEIILVVIGILLALQVNNWNEDRILRKKEKVYLQRLVAENRQDQIAFSNLINDLHMGIESAENLSFILRQEESIDSMVVELAINYFQYAAILPNFSSSRSTFDDLSSTGNLEIISNVQLRDQIVGHYADIDRVQDRMRINNEWALLLDGPFQFKNNIMQFEKTTINLFPRQSFKEKANNVQSNRLEYINNAATHHWINQDGIRLLEELKTQSEKLVIDIKGQIEDM